MFVGVGCYNLNHFNIQNIFRRHANYGVTRRWCLDINLINVQSTVTFKHNTHYLVTKYGDFKE